MNFINKGADTVFSLIFIRLRRTPPCGVEKLTSRGPRNPDIHLDKTARILYLPLVFMSNAMNSNSQDIKR